MNRQLRRLIDRFVLRFGYDPVACLPIAQCPDLQLVGGAEYGGWHIPIDHLTEDAVCYCAGAGEDISFDLALIERFRAQVWTFDPTPRSIAYVTRVATDVPRLHFQPVGLWHDDVTLTFHPPADPAHVSHSILNLQGSDKPGFDAACRRLSRIMAEAGHTRLDLLKMDIEGAEYAVIDSILEDHVEIGILCVEFDELHALKDQTQARKRVAACIKRLANAGFTVVHANSKGNYTFLRTAH